MVNQSLSYNQYVNNLTLLMILLSSFVLTNAQANFFDKFRDGTYSDSVSTTSSDIINTNQERQLINKKGTIRYSIDCYLEPRVNNCVIIKDGKIVSKC